MGPSAIRYSHLQKKLEDLGYDVHDEGNVEVPIAEMCKICLLYTSDAADERSSVDLGGRRIIKKKIKWSKWWSVSM